MSSLFGPVLPYVVAAFCLIGAWAVALVYLDLFTPDDVRAWRRLAAMRGYAMPRGRIEKFALRAGFVSRIQEELDLNRLLAIANRRETPLAFLFQSVAVGGAIGAIFLAIDGVIRATTGDWILGLGPWLALLLWVIITMILVAGLRSEVRHRQDNAGRALGDMMMLVAIMTDGRGLQLEDAVRILSKCVTHDHLEAIVDRRGWQRLIRQPYRNTIELYRMIGEEYRVSAFTQLADAASNANIGFSERDTYTRMAKSVYQQRLAEAKMRAARAKILVTLPVAGMLIPLLLLLGAPTFHSITTGLTG